MLKAINLALAFVLELVMIAAYAYWGFRLTDSLLLNVALGIGAPLLVMVIWGLFLAPRSEKRLTGASYLVLKSVLMGGSMMALAVAGQPTAAIIFAVVAVINQGLLILWNQETFEQAATG